MAGSALSESARFAGEGAEFSVETATAGVASFCAKAVVANRAIDVRAAAIKILVAFILTSLLVEFAFQAQLHVKKESIYMTITIILIDIRLSLDLLL